MQDADGQISAPLDPSVHIGDVNLPAIHPDRRFASPHLNEEPGEKAECRADHEERAHRRDLRGENPGPITSHTTPRPSPATQPIAAMRLTSASRAGHSDRFDVSIRRTVPAGPLAAPRKPAKRFAK